MRARWTTAVAALVAGAIAASCSVASCESSLTANFDTSPLEIGTTYTLAVWIENGRVSTSGEFTGGETLGMTVPLGDMVEGREAYVYADLRHSTDLVAEFTGEVAFSREQPVPGGDTCWDGTIDRR